MEEALFNSHLLKCTFQFSFGGCKASSALKFHSALLKFKLAFVLSINEKEKNTHISVAKKKCTICLSSPFSYMCRLQANTMTRVAVAN